MAEYPGTKPRRLGQMEVYAVARKAGFTPTQAIVMVAIAGAESGFDVNSFNNTPATGDYSIGLWQINLYGGLRSRLKEWGLTDERQLLDPLTNAQAAYHVFHGQGYAGWTTYTSGAYKANLSNAQMNTVPDSQVSTYVTSAETVGGETSGVSGSENPGVLIGEAAGALVPGANVHTAGDIGGAIGSTVAGGIGIIKELGNLGLANLFKLLFAFALGVMGLLFLFHKQVTTAGKIGAMAA